MVEPRFEHTEFVMINVNFKLFEEKDRSELVTMVRALYHEDPGGKPMDSEKVGKTNNYLTTHPDQGKVMILYKNQIVIGYSILINYWSNEFGGKLLFIDELYIKREFRSQGVGTAFLRYLEDSYKKDFKAIVLEVNPSNTAAVSLYKGNGFTTASNLMMNYIL